MCKTEELGREKTLARAKQMVFEEAIQAGVDSENLVIVDWEEVPLSCLPGNASKICVEI